MRYSINEQIEVCVADYWRDYAGKRWIVTSVNPNEIVAMSEEDSIERTFGKVQFYRKFRFEM